MLSPSILWPGRCQPSSSESVLFQEEKSPSAVLSESPRVHEGRSLSLPLRLMNIKNNHHCQGVCLRGGYSSIKLGTKYKKFCNKSPSLNYLIIKHELQQIPFANGKSLASSPRIEWNTGWVERIGPIMPLTRQAPPLVSRTPQNLRSICR